MTSHGVFFVFFQIPNVICPIFHVTLRGWDVRKPCHVIHVTPRTLRSRSVRIIFLGYDRWLDRFSPFLGVKLPGEEG